MKIVSQLPILLFSEYINNGKCSGTSYYWYFADLNKRANTTDVDMGFLKGALDLRPIFMTPEFCQIDTGDAVSYSRMFIKSGLKDDAIKTVRAALEKILSKKSAKTWDIVRVRLAKHLKLPKYCPLSKDTDDTDYAIRDKE